MRYASPATCSVRDPAGERDASLEAFLASCGDQINASEIHGSKETAVSREIKKCKMHGRTCLAGGLSRNPSAADLGSGL
jgi:hypothetical protein